MTGIGVCALAYMSNHCHLLLWVTDAEQLSDFMRYVNSNVAREAGRLHSWGERFWGRRYTEVVVSHEPEAQVRRLKYILQQGVKEGLVESPRHWPGAQSADCLAVGEPLRGVWIDRTAMYRARRSKEPIREEQFASVETLELAPLPCWEDLSVPEREACVRRLISEIRREEGLRRAGRAVLGRKRILELDPQSRPERSERSPAPRFHAVDPRVRRALESSYKLFLAAYRQAAKEIKAGLPSSFPAGCFPGPGQFVPLRI